MSIRRYFSSVGPTHLLLAVAVAEIAVDRVCVPALRPKTGAPPGWHRMLDYAGLFLHYFVATLAITLVATHCSAAFAGRRPWRDAVAHVLVGIAAVLAAVPLVASVSTGHALWLELAFAAAVIFTVASAASRGRDIGAQVGLFAFAAPLLLHTIKAIGTSFVWTDGTLNELVVGAARGGELTVTLVALLSPYVFAPRPLSQAMTRPRPVVIAVAIAIAGVLAVRSDYPAVARAVSLAIGFQLRSDRTDPRLALYLLALATLSWTIASCVFASAPARRRIGHGLALIVCGGYAFRWPHHYLLPLLGLTLIAEAVRRVRVEELADIPIKATTPAIADAAWSSYLGALKTQFATALGGSGVHTLTVRGDHDMQSSLVIGDANGIPMRIRIDRIDGAVVLLDVVAGREFDEDRNATVSLSAVQSDSRVSHPPGPPAAPKFVTGDAAFDGRFRSRGNAVAFQRLFDADLRARAAATLDGWLAYWEGGGLRYRVYPGHGAPLDHPLPLSDLALGRPATPDRIVAVIALLRDIAARVE